jgi:hypothetical protein
MIMFRIVSSAEPGPQLTWTAMYPNILTSFEFWLRMPSYFLRWCAESDQNLARLHILEVEVYMALKKEYVRDGRNRIIGNVTSGFNDESKVVRDDHGILGRTSDRFHTTRRTDGSLVSINSSDPGLLIPKK